MSWPKGRRKNLWQHHSRLDHDSITKIFILANPSYALQEWKKILYTWESIFYISASFTYVGIDIPSVEVLKKNKLFVDRCQKHRVQNWSWLKISRVRNWYVIRNGLAVYNFAIMKRSSTRWNWYPISWSFENIRKSLSKEHKINWSWSKILQWRNRYVYPESVQN